MIFSTKDLGTIGESFVERKDGRREGEKEKKPYPSCYNIHKKLSQNEYLT